MAEDKNTLKKTDERTAKDKNLALVLTQIEKEYGKGSIMFLGDEAFHSDVTTISTGSLSLDLALGVGGLPRGRVVEIYGPESSGKTTVCLHVIANAQKAGGTCAIIDAENALDATYAGRIGVKVADLLVSQPDCGEDALNIAENLIRSNSIDVLVIDSVAALVPKAEIEGSMGDSHMGLQARLMSQALRKMTSAINKSRTCVIFTNQIRSKIGIVFGNPETTTGGNALKFYSSIRLDIRRIAPIKDAKGEQVGSRTKVKVVKNKLAPPFKEAEFDIEFSEGISRAGSVLDVGIDTGVIEKRGAWLSFAGEQLGQGRDQVKELIKNNAELENKILTTIKEKIKEIKTVKTTSAIIAEPLQ